MDHDAGHFGALATAGLNFVAGGMGLEVAFIVNRGQSCVVAQPHTMAFSVDMQRDETVH